jgi:hypothetical protein
MLVHLDVLCSDDPSQRPLAVEMESLPVPGSKTAACVSQVCQFGKAKLSEESGVQCCVK